VKESVMKLESPVVAFGSPVVATAVLVACVVVGPAERGNAQAAAPSGDTVFKQRCAGCPTIARGEPNGVGPNLAGVVGRKAASLTFGYSPALKKVNLVWSKPNLDRFLTAPQQMAPGTRMSVKLPHATPRPVLIAHLEKAK
jgi:cytochrome c